MARIFIFLLFVMASLSAGLPIGLWAQKERPSSQSGHSSILTGRRQKSGERTFAIAELNCENLFDTIHATGHADEQYTPQSSRHWETQRYRRKLNSLAREIVSMDAPAPPDIVALLEVENAGVLSDLTTRTPLSPLGYRYIIGDGADNRGINTALLYLEGSFRPTRIFQLLGKSEQRAMALNTRSILGVQGVARSGDTLTLLVVHAPSKVGGTAADKKRAIVFGALRRYANSLLSTPQHANIIILGDFNEEASAPALRKQLDAQAPPRNPRPDRLYNLALRPHSLHGTPGTYRYQGHWQMIDQCLLSGTLLYKPSTKETATGTNDAAISTKDAATVTKDAVTGTINSTTRNVSLYADEQSLIIIDHPFLLEADNQFGGNKPWRTYYGSQYRGGFSDHLPFLLRLYYH